MKPLFSKLYRQRTLELFENTELIEHVELAEEMIEGASRKNLAQKNSGKFYTPKEIALPLIEQALQALAFDTAQRKLRIIDPFCGDGRLLTWLLPKLEKLGRDVEIHLWDYDQEAVSLAQIQLQSKIKQLDIQCHVYAKKTDTFSEFFKGWENNFDLVITNPPWEVIKPDPKELRQFSETNKEKYIRSLKEFSNRLSHDFPLSRPNKAYGGWGVNLARVGTELSVRLAKTKGIVALVAPSTIFADQNSSELRTWLFSENNLEHVNIYPAELKLFSGVDQPCVSFVLKRNTKQHNLRVTNYQALLNPKNLLINNIGTILPSINYVFPLSIMTSKKSLNLFSNLSRLPKLSELEDLEGLWLGRELDETNHKSWLHHKGKYRFIKGRDVDRFEKLPNGAVFINEAVLDRKLPASLDFYRVAWRDVSRPNQKRRVIATLLPPGHVTGNSLGVLHMKDSNYQKKLGAILGLISSLVFEFQLRAYLATAHVSAGVIRKVSIPNWSNEFIERLSSFVEMRMMGNQEIERTIEVYVAKEYGLNREQFSDLLEAFPKLSSLEKNMLLDSKLWNI